MTSEDLLGAASVAFFTGGLVCLLVGWAEPAAALMAFAWLVK